MNRSCGYCFFAEETGSTDILWCSKLREHRDIMAPECGCFDGTKKVDEYRDWIGAYAAYCEDVDCDHYDWTHMSCDKLMTPEQCEAGKKQMSLYAKHPGI